MPEWVVKALERRWHGSRALKDVLFFEMHVTGTGRGNGHGAARSSRRAGAPGARVGGLGLLLPGCVLTSPAEVCKQCKRKTFLGWGQRHRPLSPGSSRRREAAVDSAPGLLPGWVGSPPCPLHSAPPSRQGCPPQFLSGRTHQVVCLVTTLFRLPVRFILFSPFRAAFIIFILFFSFLYQWPKVATSALE